MDFPTVLGSVTSLVVLAYLWGYAFLNQGRPGSKSILWLISLMVGWALASFLEPWLPWEAKLWAKNFGSSLSYCIPAALWSFVRSYTGRIEGGRQTREAWGIALLVGWGLFMTVLVFTDSWHHLFRKEVFLVSDQGGTYLGVRSTSLALVFISLTYVAIGASLVPLVVASFHNGGAVRIQLGLFLLAILVTAGYALYRQFGGKVDIPLYWLFTVSGLLLVVGAYRYDFLRVTPIARDLAFDVLEEGIVVCSVDGRVMDVNAAARGLLVPGGGTDEQLARILDESLPQRRTLTAARQTQQSEFVVQHPAGPRTLHLSTYPVVTGKRVVLGCVSVVRDVTVVRQQNAVLVEKAERDGLTGLFNRATFVDRVERQLLDPTASPVLLVFDIDDFKGINDEFGHLRGDDVLRSVCERVRTDLREGDVFGRLGGDEFAVYLSGLDSARVLALAERIRQGVAALNVLPRPVTLSIGFAALSASTFTELYHRADQALYQAKRQGKNQVSS